MQSSDHLPSLPARQDGPFFGSEMILGNQTALLDPTSLQGCIPWDSSKQAPEEAKFFSLEVSRVVILLSAQLPPLRILSSTIYGHRSQGCP